VSKPEFSKELTPYVKAARNLGWTVVRTNGYHVQFRPPPGSPWPIVVFSSSPSDGRANKNSFALLKRCRVLPGGKN